ncbi:hypothetical protein DVH24_012131 [Malus domestica]|uniref:Uncharacterized protein n=1 Tax=Malus domestica TaxID=3750 RepID=A0A498HSJ3_MALDO|nr:hypothetical protein DVH24_012131 [Malus domestica]
MLGDNNQELHNYYKKSLNKWKANLKQKYFHTPRTTISVLNAIFIIIRTFIQIVCAIISEVIAKHQC